MSSVDEEVGCSAWTRLVRKLEVGSWRGRSSCSLRMKCSSDWRLFSVILSSEVEGGGGGGRRSREWLLLMSACW